MGLGVLRAAVVTSAGRDERCLEPFGITDELLVGFEKVVGVKFLEDLIGLKNRFFKCPEQIGPWDVITLGKFLRSVSRGRRSTNAADNPLTDVAGQMENQIANAIITLVGPPPDVFIGKLFETTLDFR